MHVLVTNTTSDTCNAKSENILLCCSPMHPEKSVAATRTCQQWHNCAVIYNKCLFIPDDLYTFLYFTLSYLIFPY